MIIPDDIDVKKNVVFTICAPNYLNRACTLMESVKQYIQPQLCVILVAEKEMLRIICDEHLDELNLPASLIDRWTREEYDDELRHITKFCTAIKPFIFHWLFAQNYKRAIYIDPDCVVYHKSPLFGMLKNYDAILFPHIINPELAHLALPPDCWDKTFTELILRVGVYNCGMIGFSRTKQSMDVIEWWGNELLSHWDDTADNFTFTDQSWANIMPSLLNVNIVRDGSYNVAYWNLHERAESIKKIYHFSGYSTLEPHKISRHVNKLVPYDLRSMFIDYAVKIIERQKITYESYGYHNVQSGIAHHTRKIDNLLSMMGLCPIKRYLVADGYEVLHDCEQSEIADAVKLRLWHVNADRLKHEWIELPQVKNIGVWFWELQEAPSYMKNSADYLDQVWVWSRFCYDSLRPLVKDKLVYMKPFMSVDLLSAKKTKMYGKFTVFYMCDNHSSINRKNPLGVIRAFKSAFKSDEARLILKIAHATEAMIGLVHFSLSGYDYTLITDTLSRHEILVLYQQCHIYVSLHRSEGLGMTMMEAMAHGKPTIATRYGGNVDFMNDSNSILIDYDLVPVEDRLYTSGVWADPSIDQAAHHMRRLMLDHELYDHLSNKCVDYLWEHHNPIEAGLRMVENIIKLI